MKLLLRLHRIVLVAIALDVMAHAWSGWRIGRVAHGEDENRRLIAGLQTNYATNADFRRLVK